MSNSKTRTQSEYQGGKLYANKGVCKYCHSTNTYSIYGGKFDKHQYCGDCLKTSK